MKTINTVGSRFSFEEIENELKQEQENAKKKGKLYYSIYNFLNNTSFCGYKTKHTLLHPWKIIDYGWYEVRYAWDRVFKGYDCRVAWSIDHYLNKMIPLWVEEIREYSGIPMQIFRSDDYDEKGYVKKEAEERAKKEWNEILNKIIAGFQANQKMMDIMIKTKEEYKEQEKIWQEGMQLFIKYYNSLWT